MIRIDFEQVLRENPIVVLTADKINALTTDDKKLKFRLDKIQNKTPMRFSKINTTIHRMMDDLDYIDFWKGVEIWIC